MGRVVLEYPKKGLFSKPVKKPICVVSFHGGAGENGSFQGICEEHNGLIQEAGLASSWYG